MRLNVGVVFGGKSVEHEVSIISALQMLENINQIKYNPITIYLSKDNEFYYHEDMKDISYFKDLNHIKHESQKVIFQNSNHHVSLYGINKNKLKKLYDLDVIFLVVHGTSCEDGTLAAYFELLDIPYVGSTTLPAGINQNKWIMKQVLNDNNIPIVPYYGFYESDFYQNKEAIINNCMNLEFPLIVKPATLGSSVGISKCLTKDDLDQAIITALQYDNQIIVEKEVRNLLEYNCSVLGDESHLEASCIERVISQDEILSYQDKYLRGGKQSSKGMVSTNRELPAIITDELEEKIQSLAIKAIKITGGSGVLRIDFLYDKENNQLYLNEINTIPGSLAFYLWKAKGVSYKELIDRLITIALRNYQKKNAKIFSYETNLLSLSKNFKGKCKI